MAECASHLSADKQFLCDRAEYSEADFILNPVAHHRAADTLSPRLLKFMPVVPALERPLPLDICEVMIPFKLRDPSDPPRAEGKHRNDAKGSNNLRTDSRQRLCDRRSYRSRRSGRCEIQPLDPRMSRRRHDARQIFGIHEEQEHLLQRKGNPLLELSVVDHERPSTMRAGSTYSSER